MNKKVNKKKKQNGITDYTSAKRSIAKAIYIIGMLICVVGIIIPIIIKDYYTATAVSLNMIISTVSFILFFTKERYSLFMGIMATILSMLLFPSIMLTTDFAQQAILYQFIVPIIWTLAVADVKKFSIWPIISALFLCGVDGFKLTKVLGLSQGIEYSVIFLVIYSFIYYITKIYIGGTYYAFNKANEARRIDYLTTAYNRCGIEDEVSRLIKTKEPFYLVYIDLDNFKNVNDTLGHKAGDELLVGITQLWWERLYDVYGCVGRLGGDEFALIIRTDSKEYTESVIKRAINEIRLSNNDLLKNITMSAGIVSYPNDGKTLTDLFMYADTALYKAKLSGKNTYQFFDKKIFNEIISEYQLKDSLSNALNEDRLYLMYQPQVDIHTHKIYGFESLLRLKDMPNTNIQNLIRIAEKSSLIYDIDLKVLDIATRDCLPLVKKNKNLLISVNISGKHMTSDKLVDNIKKVLDKNKFPAKNLCIEITESTFIKSLTIAKENIHEISKLGIKFALDDFGMGYSSFAYLSELQVDHIKIEKFFIDSILEDKASGRLADVIVNIGHLFKYKVIAEGVESKEQLYYLDNKCCDIIQGYIYSKPLTVTDAEKICNKKLKYE